MASAAPVCRYFASTGNCYYGDQCNFAHTYRPGEHPSSSSTSTPTPAPAAVPTPSLPSTPVVGTGAASTAGTLPKAQRPCRNILIHGYCKYMGKGCDYSHDAAPGSMSEDGTQGLGAMTAGGLSSYNPGSMEQQQYGLVYNPTSRLMSPVPSVDYGAQQAVTHYPPHYGYAVADSMKMGGYSSPNLSGNLGGNKYYVPQNYVTPQMSNVAPVKGGSVRAGGMPATTTPHPNALPHVEIKPTGARRTSQYFFLSDNLRQDFAKRSATTYNNLNSDDPRVKDLPRLVHRYHSLQPLEEREKPAATTTTGGSAGTSSTAGSSTTPSAPISKVFGQPTTVYKCQSATDGLPYVLRRVEGFRVSNEYILNMLESWRNLTHPGIVTLREAFVSKDFGGEPSLVFVYDYYPGAVTVEAKYFTPTAYITEQIVWSYIIQLFSALKAIHSAGLSCRIVNPSKILVTGKNRVRINGVGVMDILHYEPNKNLPSAQQEDYLALGRLMLNLACKSGAASQNVPKSLEYVSSHYSAELKNFFTHVLTRPALPSLADEISTMIQPYLLRELDNLHNYNDNLESELSKELDNGRLFRLITKLGFINERPEFALDPNWSETGDRYLLKLFRDYVFHQVYEDGTPMVDLAHVVDCLNKLDAGSSEKLVLTSRDEQSMLVVSYRDLKRCVETAFHELVLAAAKTPNTL